MNDGARLVIGRGKQDVNTRDSSYVGETSVKFRDCSLEAQNPAPDGLALSGTVVARATPGGEIRKTPGPRLGQWTIWGWILLAHEVVGQKLDSLVSQARYDRRSSRVQSAQTSLKYISNPASHLSSESIVKG